MKGKVTVLSGAFLLILCLAAIFSDSLSRISYEVQDMGHILQTPSLAFWFGTDDLGRDLFSRILFGARVSLSVGLISSFLSLFIGTAYGIFSGYMGGRWDALGMRAVDFFQSIPPLVLMILISVVVNAYDLWSQHEVLRDTFAMIVALTLVGWVGVSRLVRTQVLQVKALPFVEAARASGAGALQIALRHILPQLSGSLIVTFTYLVPNQILNESFLSFIGLGLQPPYSSWGVLANEGWRSFRTYPHLILFPGAAIFLTMLCSQYLGDGLRDELDPH